MRGLRRHPSLLPLTVAGAAALGYVAGTNEWSDLGVYAGMTGLIFVLTLITVILEIRHFGRDMFKEGGRPPLHRTDQ